MPPVETPIMSTQLPTPQDAPLALTASKRPPKNIDKHDTQLSKRAFLAGLPRSVVQRVEAAYQTTALGTGVPIPRDSRPDGSSRRGQFPEWVFRLLEAAFAVEDEIESELAHTGGTAPSSPRMTAVNELRRRRNAWLDAIGENEAR